MPARTHLHPTALGTPWKGVAPRGRMVPSIASVVLMTTSLFVVATPARAGAGATITVGALTDAPAGAPDGACSLREAIINAEADTDRTGGDCLPGSGDDRIVFSASGTVPLVATLPPITDPDGLAIDGGGAITVSGSGTRQIVSVTADGVLELSGLRLERGLAPVGGAVLNLGRLTITAAELLRNEAAVSGGAVWNGGVLRIVDSLLSGNGAGVAGGAVYSNDDVSFTGSTLTLNQAALGGAVFNQLGSVRIEGGSVTHNRAGTLGGALYNNRGGMGVFDASISDNRAGVSGGAFFNDGSLNASRDTVSRNRAELDGGAFFTAGPLIVADGAVRENLAGGSGGAVYAKSSAVSVRRSDVSGNRAEAAGGGIHGDGAAMNISQSIFSGNGAGDGGGAVSSASGTALISNSALVQNAGGGLHLSEGTASLSFSTVAANSGGGAIADAATITFASTIVSRNDGGNCVGPGQDFGYNLEFEPAAEPSCGFALHPVWGDPNLGPVDGETGVGPPIAPGTGSAALDAIPVGEGRCGTSTTEDVRGVTRPQGPACDIGALELRPAPDGTPGTS